MSDKLQVLAGVVYTYIQRERENGEDKTKGEKKREIKCEKIWREIEKVR